MNTRIVKLRKTLGISQKDFGKTLSISSGYMNDIEKGTCNITDRIIICICAKFNVNEDWLRNRYWKYV